MLAYLQGFCPRIIHNNTEPRAQVQFGVHNFLCHWKVKESARESSRGRSRAGFGFFSFFFVRVFNAAVLNGYDWKLFSSEKKKRKKKKKRNGIMSGSWLDALQWYDWTSTRVFFVTVCGGRTESR